MTRWFDLPRVPEPEVMDDSGEAAAYAGAAAQAYLSGLDDSFVARAMGLLPADWDRRPPGKTLDIGCGPGQIAHKLAARLPGWLVVGVDRSAAMIGEARHGASRIPAFQLHAQTEFFFADGTNLPFADGAFDLVICNSVLHHLERPARLFAEIARVARPSGAILLRDLRRPSRFGFSRHVRRYGGHYSGAMLRLYCDSLRAAYTPAELSQMLRSSPVPGARAFTEGRTHLGFEKGCETGFERSLSGELRRTSRTDCYSVIGRR